MTMVFYFVDINSRSTATQSPGAGQEGCDPWFEGIRQDLRKGVRPDCPTPSSCWRPRPDSNRGHRD